MKRVPCPTCGCTRRCAAMRRAEHWRRRTDAGRLYARVAARAARRDLAVAAYVAAEAARAARGESYDAEAVSVAPRLRHGHTSRATALAEART